MVDWWWLLVSSFSRLVVQVMSIAPCFLFSKKVLYILRIYILYFFFRLAYPLLHRFPFKNMNRLFAHCCRTRVLATPVASDHFPNMGSTSQHPGASSQNTLLSGTNILGNPPTLKQWKVKVSIGPFLPPGLGLNRYILN